MMIVPLLVGCATYSSVPVTTCGATSTGPNEAWSGAEPPALFEPWASRPVVFAGTEGDAAPMEIEVSVEIAEEGVQVTTWRDCPFVTYSVGDLVPRDSYSRLVAPGKVALLSSDGRVDLKLDAEFTFSPHTLAFVTASIPDMEPIEGFIERRETLELRYLAGFELIEISAVGGRDSRLVFSATAADVIR